MKPNSPAACAYKLDLSKAYDRVDWEFLEQALIKWGFSLEWISWIMACVKSVKYSVKFNGKLLESFTPSRGLRQGDPLSPFLFLFIADALSSLLSKLVHEGEFKGVQSAVVLQLSHIYCSPMTRCSSFLLRPLKQTMSRRCLTHMPTEGVLD